MHLLAFIGLDHSFDWAAIAREILKRPYAFIGMACLLLLIPLAATSTNGMIRRLGAKNWTRLHKLVYPAALLAVAHFIFAVKSWPLEPLLYAAGALALLAVRLAPKRRLSLKQPHEA